MRNGRRLTIALAVLAIVTLIYVGSYLALVERPDPAFGFNPLVFVGPNGLVYAPSYRIGEKASQLIFMPIHALDRQLRPRYWGRRRLADPYDTEVFYP